jgi:hypothetical protein
LMASSLCRPGARRASSQIFTQEYARANLWRRKGRASNGKDTGADSHAACNEVGSRRVESAGELAAGGVEREYAGGRVKEVDIAGRSGNDEVTELRTVVQASECAC